MSMTDKLVRREVPLRGDEVLPLAAAVVAFAEEVPLVPFSWQPTDWLRTSLADDDLPVGGRIDEEQPPNVTIHSELWTSNPRFDVEEIAALGFAPEAEEVWTQPRQQVDAWRVAEPTTVDEMFVAAPAVVVGLDDDPRHVVALAAGSWAFAFLAAPDADDVVLAESLVGEVLIVGHRRATRWVAERAVVRAVGHRHITRTADER